MNFEEIGKSLANRHEEEAKAREQSFDKEEHRKAKSQHKAAENFEAIRGALSEVGKAYNETTKQDRKFDLVIEDARHFKIKFGSQYGYTPEPSVLQVSDIIEMKFDTRDPGLAGRFTLRTSWDGELSMEQWSSNQGLSSTRTFSNIESIVEFVISGLTAD